MEPELINNSWIQTNAYLLQSIKELIANYTGNTSNGNCSGCTGCSGCTTNITVQPSDVILNQTICLPQQYSYICNPLPIITTQNNVIHNVTYVTPPPKVIDISRNNAYSRVCGTGPEFDDCKRCVDKWLDAHTDGFHISELTSSGTGCSSKRKPQYSQVSPKPIPYISCCERKKIAKAIEYEEYKERIANSPASGGMRIFNRNSQEYKDYLDSLI